MPSHRLDLDMVFTNISRVNAKGCYLPFYAIAFTPLFRTFLVLYHKYILFVLRMLFIN